MDGKRFDSLARTIGGGGQGRDAFQALSGCWSHAARRMFRHRPEAAAQVTVERRFNCAAVGDKCKGNDSNCCSGRCKALGLRGVRIARSRRDKSKCVAHDQAGCSANQDTCDSGQRVACGGGSGGGCLKTTGNAGFCGQVQTGQSPPRLQCTNCETDREARRCRFRARSCVRRL